MRDDAVAVLIQMGLRRPEAQRGVDHLLASRDDITSVQDIITEYLRASPPVRSAPGRLGSV